MARLKKKKQPKPEIQIAPMIDCVFLLLIYFMVSATLEKQEADLSFQLPGTIEQTEALEIPDEQIIEIREDGQVIVNDFAYDSPDAIQLIELTAMLTRFKETSSANQVEAIVTISPADLALHETIVRVMDACAIAGIDSVNFALGDTET
ncbi:MAG: biopolymer transporter ExbD [Verrucomicrobiota bacterium]